MIDIYCSPYIRLESVYILLVYHMEEDLSCESENTEACSKKQKNAKRQRKKDQWQKKNKKRKRDRKNRNNRKKTEKTEILKRDLQSEKSMLY